MASTSGDVADIAAVRSLMAKRETLAAKCDELKGQAAALEKELRDTKKQIKDIDEQVALESDKDFREKSLAAAPSSAHSKSGGNDGAEDYPHAATRTLRVKPAGRPNAKRKKRSENDSELVFNDFSSALKASKSGDMIELPDGLHCPDIDQFNIKKSLQIVGVGSDVTIGSDEYIESLLQIEGSHVRIAHVKIDGTHVLSEGLVRVQEGGRVWLEDCEVKVAEGFIEVHKDSYAFIRRCTIRGGEGPAIQIDPQAKEVLISGCNIMGSGAGTKDYDDEPFYVAGQTGAVEVSASGFAPEHRVSLDASVSLAIIQSNIVSCFGGAVTYRTNHTCKRHFQPGRWGDSKENFEWPGTTSITFEGNTIKSNGLALPSGLVPDGEIIMHNTRPEIDDREGGTY